MNLYEKLSTLQRIKLRSVKVDDSIIEARKLSEQNIAIQKQEFSQRQNSKTQKPKFLVGDSRGQKTEKVKSLQTYERRITDKIKAITDKDLWLNQDAIKLDRFRLPIKTENLPQYETVDMKNLKTEYSPIGYQYEPVINLDALNTEYQELINSKHSDKREKSKDEIREYNRLQKARRRKEIRDKESFKTNVKKWQKERGNRLKGLKMHIAESILEAYISRINQKDSLPLTYTQRLEDTKQHCITTYELMEYKHYLSDIQLAKIQLEESNQKTDKIINWQKDYWNSEIFDKKTNSIISIRTLFNRKPKKLACLDIEGSIFYV